ncbi:MAG: winged helix-turn-helix domain-containing protein [Vicinamibacterales bacterium]
MKVPFGDLTLDLRTGELFRAGASLKLQPQPAKVLVLLVRRAGEIVSREEIVREVWGSETFVDYEQGLNYAVRQIRAALQDEAEHPRYIETLPKRGYRFIAVIEKDSAAAGGATTLAQLPAPAISDHPQQWRSGRTMSAVAAAVIILAGVSIFLMRHLRSPAAKPDKLMVAVLPLRDLSGEKQQAYFSDGMTEELITELGRIQPTRLAVIARTYSMAYRDSNKTASRIGQELGVQYVVEGSIRREGQRLRITAQLVQASDQTQVWAESYDRDAREILAVEGEVARAISQAIGRDLLPTGTTTHRTMNPEAYDNYLRGRYFWNKGTAEGYALALKYFGSAATEAPTDAAPHAALAETHNMTGYWMIAPPRQVFPLAKQEAARALELDPSLPEAHAALGYAEMEYDWDLIGAEQEFTHALELDPNSASTHEWYGTLLFVSGRIPAGLQEIAVAHSLDPLSMHVTMVDASGQYMMRRYDEAIRELGAMREVDPAFSPAYQLLGAIYLKTGHDDKAVEAWERSMTLDGTPAPAVANLDREYRERGLHGFLRAENELYRQAERSAYLSPVLIAMNDVSLGDTDAVFKELDEAYQQRSGWLLELGFDPVWDPVRSDPRFRSLVRRVKAGPPA